MSELDLLCQAIQTQDTVEAGDVKFLYMDENTIYRFQNNKMKPISKTLMNKAKKLIANQSKPLAKARNPRARKSARQTAPIYEDEEEQDDIEPHNQTYQYEDENTPPLNEPHNEEPPPQPRKPQPRKPSRNTPRITTDAPPNISTYNIDLDEYYNNKNKMEYMAREMERMNHKITKLKQYKTLINKITGGEIDDLPQQSIDTPSYRSQQPAYNASARVVNDNLFM